MTTLKPDGPVLDVFDRPVPGPVADAISCPDWCTGHEIDAEGPWGRAVFHHPPTFGMVEGALFATLIDGTPLNEAAPLMYLADEEWDAARLRRLAADALAAAEWLEGQR